MIDRLNRILSLSKKTGDTVVIHDPTQAHDVVVLPFEQYEELVSSNQFGHGDYDEYLLEEMSERELIDKINRDIAIWRSYQELNTRDKQAALLEDQLADEPLSDPFEEDFAHHTDWHRVSDLIDTRHKKRKLNEDDSAEPIHTYTPVEEPRSFQPMEVTSGISMDSSGVSTALFEEESSLEGDDDPVFLEEPIT